MRPIKSFVPLAKWLLRITAAFIVYISYFRTALNFTFNSVGYFLALSFVVLVVLLIIGGFLRTAKLTVISGLLLLGVCIIQFFILKLNLSAISGIVPLATISFYFVARGNNG